MESDGDGSDLGGFEPTTPAAPSRRVTRPGGGSSKVPSSSRNVINNGVTKTSAAAAARSGVKPAQRKRVHRSPSAELSGIEEINPPQPPNTTTTTTGTTAVQPSRYKGKQRSTTAKKGKAVQEVEMEVQELDEEEEEENDEDEDEVVHIEPPPPPPQPNASKRVRSSSARASKPPPPKASSSKPKAGKSKQAMAKETAVVDVDMDVEADAEQAAKGLMKALNNAADVHRSHLKEDESRLQKLRTQNAELTTQLQTIQKQMEDLLRIRETEPERLRLEQERQYEVQVQAQESLIKELTSQLAKKIPLTQNGKGSILHLITREAADEEKRSMQNELDDWRIRAEERQRTIRQQQARIAELEQREKDLLYEAKAEAQRSNELAAKLGKQSGSQSRLRTQTNGTGLLGGEDPKHAEVVRFYEDLTNLLVTNVKPLQSQYPNLDLDEWLFTCVYTYNAKGGPAQKTLSFTLRLCHDIPDGYEEPITSVNQLDEAVHFSPINLDKEDLDFVERLGFLSAPFTFGREQMPVFLSTINSALEDALKVEIDVSV